MNEAQQFFGALFRSAWICCSSNEGGEKNMPIGRAAREERGIPHGAEDAKPRRARNEKAEAFERMADFFLRVAKGNDGDRGILNRRQECFERRVELREQLPRHIRWRGKNHVLCRYRIVAASLQRNVEGAIVLPENVGGRRFRKQL